jgi:hypothetical protein
MACIAFGISETVLGLPPPHLNSIANSRRRIMLKESPMQKFTCAVEAVAWPFRVCYLFAVNMY